jgi:hypothetical protein
LKRKLKDNIAKQEGRIKRQLEKKMVPRMEMVERQEGQRYDVLKGCNEVNEG